MDMREKVARALYERERARAENATLVLSGAAGRPVTGMAMEPWEECGETYLGDADAVLEAMRDADMEMRIAGRDAYLRAHLQQGADFSVGCGLIYTAMLDHARNQGG